MLCVIEHAKDRAGEKNTLIFQYQIVILDRSNFSSQIWPVQARQSVWASPSSSGGLDFSMTLLCPKGAKSSRILGPQ